MCAATSAWSAQQGAEQSSAKGQQAQAGKTASQQNPLVVLFPPILVVNEGFANGCWARLYEGENFTGDILTLAGPGDIAHFRISAGTFARKWDSVVVGLKATLTAFDHENFTQRTATFKPGQRVPDLDEKLGFFENIRSARLACSK